ncbi:MAG: hypothetical protein J6O62_00495 [Bacilli bacterium]|nr:hypothetical protein [Bacilli bacterium]
MNEMYFIKKNVDKLYEGGYTTFLDMRFQNLINQKMKIDYNVFKPFEESERVIYYVNEKPNIVLYEIQTDDVLRHQDIMGTIYSLGLDETLFGDIIVDNDKYYIYMFDTIENYVVNNVNMIKKSKVKLVKIDIDYLKDYKRKYEEITLIVSSKRIDTIVSRLTNINRKEILDKIKNEEVLVNYSPVKNNSYILKENDIFSIRKYGKYRFNGVINQTKKENLVVKIDKYL